MIKIAIVIVIIILMLIIKLIAVTMKMTIVSKLMKIVVGIHNPKTYICSDSDNSQQEF